jgi:hypothetical protein
MDLPDRAALRGRGLILVPSDESRPLAGPALTCAGGGDDGIRTRDRGFADLCLATWLRRPCSRLPQRRLAAPRGFEPRFTDPKSGVLPLDEGASGPTTVYGVERREWSGRRDSNPRPSPWQGDALPTEPLPPDPDEPPSGAMMWCREPDSNWRHRDFQSRALPTELSRPADAARLLDHDRRTRHNLAGRPPTSPDSLREHPTGLPTGPPVP